MRQTQSKREQQPNNEKRMEKHTAKSEIEQGNSENNAKEISFATTMNKSKKDKNRKKDRH